jgi:hypothetical protein
MDMSEVYVMVTICSRKNMPRFVDCYKDYNVEAANISLGRGTASSDVLDLLGLEDDEKGIHMSLVTENTWKNVKKGLQSKLRIDVPGTGIAFIVPLSSIGGKRELGFLIDGQEYKKGDESTLKDTKHELIVAIANYGYNTQVMRAAEEGGATGGTVLHGKGVGRKIINTLETDEFYVRASRIEIPASITATEFYRKVGYDYKNGVKELDNEHHYRLEKFKEAGLK